MKKVAVVLGIMLGFIVLLAGCNLPSSGPTELPLAAGYTQAAETIIAELTRSAPPVTPAPVEPKPTISGGDVSTQPPQGDASSPTSLPSDTPAPSATLPPTLTQSPGLPSAAPTASGRVVFEDDFKRQGRWYEDLGDDFGFEYQDEAYVIYVNLLNAPIWSIRDQDFSDVILEVDAVRQTGPQNGYFGLVCRHQDEDNYYALVISSDGSYGIAKMEDGEFEFLDEGVDERNIIQRDDAVNRVRAVCMGETLSLYANGQLLVEIDDDDFSDGVVGLIAGTRLKDGLEALFDNFVIIEP